MMMACFVCVKINRSNPYNSQTKVNNTIVDVDNAVSHSGPGVTPLYGRSWFPALPQKIAC